MEPIELKISDLLQLDNQYIVPLYQRNFAWGEIEIIQLLQDIWDKFKEKSNSQYYIGTLVVDKRKTDDNVFEIIDGQQRHTTISLINAVINGKEIKIEKSVKKPNLYYDARIDIKTYIDSLYVDYKNAKQLQTDNIGLQNIKNAIRYIEDYLMGISDEEIIHYLNYFYDNVKIIRIGVPKDTDINHYFEVMNNRGEQLEKHEILKEKFYASSNLNDEMKVRFALIWDACSQMNRQIQLCFSTENRAILFGRDYSEIPSDGMSKNIILNRDDLESEIPFILKEHILSKDFRQTTNVTDESKFKSIIDFPNFLLQILKLENENISLDDKKLLDEFGYTKNIENRVLPDSINFINSLLYYRTLFDQYIIKREEGNDDWRWCILKPIKNKDEQLTYVNSFGETDFDDSEDEIKNKDFVMIQSMLHVSFPANNDKKWLQRVFKFFKNNRNNNTKEPFREQFKDSLLNISETFLEEYLKTGLNNGVFTRRFLFNYLDYLLWTKFNQLNLDKPNTDRFKRFKFSTNNSVEHLHPQSKIEELTILEDEIVEDYKEKSKILNNFGNLCLISQSSNSKYNDYNFKAKKDQFSKKQSVESLKQVMMFNYDEWGTKQIKDHANKMLELLKQNK